MSWIERTWSSEAIVQRGDGNQAEVGAPCEEFGSAKRRLRVMEFVALREFGGQRWVFEVPHQRSGVEKVDSGDAERGRC